MSSILVDTLRAGLQELADEEFQRRVWTGRGLPADMSSFVEAVETVFDDSGLEPDLGFGRPVLGPELDVRLVDLEASLRRIATDRTPQEIIDDPLMADIRLKAAAILELLPA